jgi:hypothetical protein
MAAAGSALPPDIAAQNKGPAILATSITVTVLSTMFVAARLFVRGRIIGKLYMDDYFMMASLVRAVLRLFQLMCLNLTTQHANIASPAVLRSVAGSPSEHRPTRSPTAAAATPLC